MAQQARPNVMNQMLFLRLQLTSWSTLVTTTPSSNRLWMRPLTSDMPSSGPILGAHPREIALPPDVRAGDHQDADEHEPLEIGEQPEGLEHGRPGQQEHRLDVEHDEDQGEHVEADVELDPGVA